MSISYNTFQKKRAALISSLNLKKLIYQALPLPFSEGAVLFNALTKSMY